MMPLVENHHVRTERATRRENYAAGISAGVDANRNELPDWIAEIYRTRTAYHRGVLLGVLLEEWGQMDDELCR